MAATSESFGEVVGLLEEEKGALERKLEAANKVLYLTYLEMEH